MMAFHYQKMLADLWIGSLYETTRMLIERKLAPDTDEYRSLAHAFRLIRIPLEKHEIALDHKLKERSRCSGFQSTRTIPTSIHTPQAAIRCGRILCLRAYQSAAP
jgi:hypothetical protein